MSKHRLELGSAKPGAPSIKRGHYEELLSKERSLSEAIAVEPTNLASLRELAHAYYHAGQWAKCVAIIEGLHALGAPALWDPIMLSPCHPALGHPDRP